MYANIETLDTSNTKRQNTWMRLVSPETKMWYFQSVQSAVHWSKQKNNFYIKFVFIYSYGSKW